MNRDPPSPPSSEEVLKEEISRLSSINSVLYEISAADLELNALMTLIAKRAETLTQADGAVVELRSGDELVYAAATGTAAASTGIRLKMAGALSGKALISGEILICTDSETDPRVDLEACRRLNIRSMVVVPLRHKNERTGVLKVYSKNVEGFTQTQVTILELMTGLLGAAMTHAYEHESRKKSEEEVRRLNALLEEKIDDRTRELEKALNLLNIINNSIPALITYIDTELRYQYVNPTYKKWFGLGPEAVLGKPLAEVIGEGFKAARPYIEEALRGNVVQFEGKIPHKTGVIKEVSVSYVPDIGPDQKIRGVVTLAQDVSEKKRNEEEHARLLANEQAAVSASKLKSEFLANMSHEIRTPMNSILGMADLLSETPLNEEQKKYVKIFRKSGTLLMNLINDILDLSKIESGSLEIEKIDFNLNELLEKLSELFSLRAQEKGIALVCKMDSDVPTQLIGDPNRLRQVLLNLIGNSIKFTSAGEIRVTVARDTEKLPDGILFSVTDSGIGMNPQQIARLFMAFSQADSSITRKYGGTGLGLSICKKLIGGMAGELQVRSQKGVGSTFFFSLPLPVSSQPSRPLPSIASSSLPASLLVAPTASTSPSAPTPAPSAPAPTPANDTRPLRILLVDDNDDNRTLMLTYLKTTPYQIVTCENGQVACDQFFQAQFDLVLLDMQMPIMDGRTATRVMRTWEKDQNKKPTPILALTANAFVEEIQASLDAGCDAHLTKPIRKRDLLQAILTYAK